MLEAWIWTAIAVAGFAYGVVNLRESRQDEEAARILNGSRRGRMILAKSEYRSEILRMGTQTIFLLVGIYAIFPDLAVRFPVLQKLVPWALVLASVFVMANSVRKRWLRKRLKRLQTQQGKGA